MLPIEAPAKAEALRLPTVLERQQGGQTYRRQESEGKDDDWVVNQSNGQVL